MNLPVTSREYKLMLNVSHFRDREYGGKEFWELVKYLASRNQATIIDLDDKDKWYKEKERTTYYLDTATLDLRRQGFIVRLREEIKKKQKKEYKLTLKYRSSDRYISASKNLSATLPDKLKEAKEPESKFEQDIVPTFSSKFSNSTSIESEQEFEIKNIKDLTEIFPGLKELELPINEKIKIVNNFKAHEIVMKINSRILFDQDYEKIEELQIKPSFSFWYLPEKDLKLPLVTEFSFDYDVQKTTEKSNSLAKNNLEQFPYPLVAESNKLFASLQKQTNWVNLNSTTKTAYAYDTF